MYKPNFLGSLYAQSVLNPNKKPEIPPTLKITFKTAFSNFIQEKDFQIFLNYTIVYKSSYTFYANQILGSFLIVTLVYLN